MLRIQGGVHRSRQLFTPPGQGTRPTRAMVREAVFSMLMGEVEDSRVLDLFAGSGAMGLEAISRGARLCVFCDNNQEAIACICKNIDLLKEKAKTAVLASNWQVALHKLAEEEHRFNLIFLDPPYKMEAETIVKALGENNLLAENGTLILETDKDAGFTSPQGFEIFKERRYGETMLRLIRAKELAE